MKVELTMMTLAAEGPTSSIATDIDRHRNCCARISVRFAVTLRSVMIQPANIASGSTSTTSATTSAIRTLVLQAPPAASVLNSLDGRIGLAPTTIVL